MRKLVTLAVVLVLSLGVLYAVKLPKPIEKGVLSGKQLGLNAGLSDIVGTWYNVDPNTRGITRLEIVRVRVVNRTSKFGKQEQKGKDYVATVKVWAKCSYSECYWGETEAQVISKSPFASPSRKLYGLTFSYDQDFAVRQMFVKFEREQLSAPPTAKLTVISYYVNSDDSRYNSAQEYTLQLRK